MIRRGFTLAEVLITLTIIGIVAAMTIPTLMTKFFEKEMDSKHKKVMETLRTGYRMMLQKDEVDDVADSTLVRCNKSDKACFNKQHEGIFAGMTTSVDNLPDIYYLSNGTSESPFKWSNMTYIFQTKDGVVYGVTQDKNTNSFIVYVDLNGNDEPNIQSKDLYKFRVSDEAKVVDVSNEIGGSWKNFGTSYSKIDCRSSNSNSDDYNYCKPTPSGLENDYWAGAKKKCADEGLTLPDEETLKAFYDNHQGQKGVTTVTNGWYWSSSESSSNPQNIAREVYLGGNHVSSSYHDKYFQHLVLCIGE